MHVDFAQYLDSLLYSTYHDTPKKQSQELIQEDISSWSLCRKALFTSNWTQYHLKSALLEFDLAIQTMHVNFAQYPDSLLYSTYHDTPKKQSQELIP